MTASSTSTRATSSTSSVRLPPRSNRRAAAGPAPPRQARRDGQRGGLTLRPCARPAENLNLAINAAKSIGITVVNIGSSDIQEGRPHLVLGLVWQVVKMALLANINLKANPNLIRLLEPGETLEAFLKLPPEKILLRWFNHHLEEARPRRRRPRAKHAPFTHARARPPAHTAHALTCARPRALARAHATPSAAAAAATALRAAVDAGELGQAHLQLWQGPGRLGGVRGAAAAARPRPILAAPPHTSPRLLRCCCSRSTPPSSATRASCRRASCCSAPRTWPTTARASGPSSRSHLTTSSRPTRSSTWASARRSSTRAPASTRPRRRCILPRSRHTSAPEPSPGRTHDLP